MSGTTSQEAEPSKGATTSVPKQPDEDAQPDPGEAMTAARQPVGTGASPLLGLLVALGLIALGVVGVQEALVRSGAVNGSSWTSGVLSWLNGVHSADWMVVVFVVAALLGLLLLRVVFWPRPRKTLALRANTGVFLRTQDLARVAISLIEGIDGVTDCNAKASRSRLKVTVTTVEPKERNGALSDRVREGLSPCLQPLARAPKASVNIRNEDLA
ncbi:MAG: DUF6286 domain-containing protein [Nocardioides sp.]